MAEQVEYATPQNATPGTLLFRVDDFEMSRSRGVVNVVYVGQNGVRIPAKWRDTESSNVATVMMRQINKYLFAPKTLERALIERGVADGFLPPGGTITGTPD